MADNNYSLIEPSISSKVFFGENLVFQTKIKNLTSAAKTSWQVELRTKVGNSVIATSNIVKETVGRNATSAKLTFNIPITNDVFRTAIENSRSATISASSYQLVVWGMAPSAIDLFDLPSNFTLVDARYKPMVNLSVLRCDNSSSVEGNDEGTQLLTTLELKLPNKPSNKGYSGMICSIKSSLAGSSSALVTKSLNVSDYLDSTKSSASLLYRADGYSTGSKYEVSVLFGDNYEYITESFIVDVAFANFHLAGSANGGVAFGRFSSSTDANPKFECAFPAYFENGIFDGNGNEIGGSSIVAEEKAVGTFMGKTLYRRALSVDKVPMGTSSVTTTLDGLVVDTLVNMYGAYYGGGAWHPVNSYYSSGFYCYARISGTNSIITRASVAMTRGYLVIEYTKEVI